MSATAGEVNRTRFPSDGCVSMFWRSPDLLSNSPITTICACLSVGQLVFDNDMLVKIGVTQAPKGYPVTSTIISGAQVSMTIYTTPDASGTDKFVVGPKEVVDLSKVERPSGAGPFNDRLRSITMMSWASCRQHQYTEDCLDF